METRGGGKEAARGWESRPLTCEVPTANGIEGLLDFIHLVRSVPKGENQELTGRVEDWKKTKAEIEGSLKRYCGQFSLQWVFISALQTRFIDEVEAREAGHHTCQELKRLIESQHTAVILSMGVRAYVVVLRLVICKIESSRPNTAHPSCRRLPL